MASSGENNSHKLTSKRAKVLEKHLKERKFYEVRSHGSHSSASDNNVMFSLAHCIGILLHRPFMP